MQKFQHEMNEHDRRIARNWHLVALCLYGSILGALVFYAALIDHRGAEYAANPAAQAKVVASRR